MNYKKTGISMGGRIENTRKVKSISCDCYNCYHSELKGEMLVCKYYQIFEPKKKRCARYYYQRKPSKKQKQIADAQKALRAQRFHYKNKPVNGEPTERQLDYLKGLCKRRNLSLSIIGINRKEASLLIDFLKGKDVKKPSCYKKYIKDKEHI